jgi:alanine racemase
MKPITHNVEEHIATCKLSINHAALCENWRILDAATPGARTGSVVKANGYGLGLGEMGLSLAAAGCEAFFVASPDEGIRLRRSLRSREIFVFSGLTARNAAEYAEANLIPVLNSLEDIAVWAEFWKLRGSRRPCAIQIDTGMNRLGLGEKDIAQLTSNKELANSVNIITVMSHLASADVPDNPMNANQLERFQTSAQMFKGSELSFANSAGIGLGPEFHFNLVRPGISIYGGECSVAEENKMKVVATAEAIIIQVHQTKKGEKIGYGGLYEFTRDSKVAHIAAGYADGYLRTSWRSDKELAITSGPGAMGWLDGHKVPVIGRVSMDYTAFDVTDVPDQVIEDASFIELIGHNILLDDAARAAGTIGYEVLTSLGQRYHRNHINQPEHSSG